MTTPDPYASLDDTDPVELVEVVDLGPEPPADWDAYAHDEEDRGASLNGVRFLVAGGSSVGGFSVPSTDNRKAIDVRTYAVPGRSDILLPLRAEVAPLLLGAAREYDLHVQRLVAGHCWGYAWRVVRGGSTPSFHAAGVAEDLNAPEHPLGTAPSANYTAAQIAACRAVARKYGLRWGGDYTGRKDGMHFEVIVGRAEALALVKRLQTPPKAPAKPAIPSAGVISGNVPLLLEGMRDPVAFGGGQYVHRLQLLLGGIEVDGAYGPATSAAVKSMNARLLKRTVDGKSADAATWRRLYGLM